MNKFPVYLIAASMPYFSAFSTQVVLSGVPAYLEPYGCVPTAEASLFGYYAINYGATGLFPSIAVTDLYLTNNVTVPIHNIALACGTDALGNTLQTNICPGLVGYATSFGYDFQANMSGNIVPGTPHGSQISVTDAWDIVVTAITNNQPSLLYVDATADGVADHVVPVFGYNDNYQSLGRAFACYTGNNEAENIVSWYKFQSVSPGVNYGVSNVAIVVPPSFVPEPSSSLIFLLMCAGAIFNRRRTS